MKYEIKIPYRYRYESVIWRVDKANYIIYIAKIINEHGYFMNAISN